MGPGGVEAGQVHRAGAGEAAAIGVAAVAVGVAAGHAPVVVDRTGDFELTALGGDAAAGDVRRTAIGQLDLTTVRVQFGHVVLLHVEAVQRRVQAAAEEVGLQAVLVVATGGGVQLLVVDVAARGGLEHVRIAGKGGDAAAQVVQHAHVRGQLMRGGARAAAGEHAVGVVVVGGGAPVSVVFTVLDGIP
ncbi:hypothetical protein G6F32_014222 [Rhizopus arrhizus]|nr:hypothetical protein G6F32_014222 [Rhizopus arrhizus]